MFSGESNVQILTDTVVKGVAENPDSPLVIPPYYSGEVLVLNSEHFGNLLENWYLGAIRRIITSKLLFKKIRVSVFDPPVGDLTNLTIPLESRRRTEHFSFICQTGVTGLSNRPPNPKALSFSRYAEDSSSTRRITNIVDRPSRFLIRGVCIPEEFALNSAEVFTLGIAVRTPRLITFGPRQITFSPKVSVLNDLLSIRTVICVGYTNVAGYSRTEREVAPPAPKAAKRPAAQPPARENPSEGGDE